MALDDWEEEAMEKTEEDEQPEKEEQDTDKTLDHMEQALLNRALQYDNVEVEGDVVKGDIRQLAVVFSLMCLDVPEAELPEP